MSVELTLLSRVSYRGREVAGPLLCGLLALLAGELRTGCGTARLVEGLWPEQGPENPTKALQLLVSRVRAQLGSDVIARTTTGYRLTVAEDRLDTSAVLLSVAASARYARAGDDAAALTHADAGLALWEGAEDADPLLTDPLSALRTERATTYRTLVRARALALARLGRHAEALESLTTVANQRPRDEEVLLELLRCEAATLGQAVALARYDDYRRSLRDELGTDPGAALRAGYQQLLCGAAPAVRHGVPYEPNPLLGRDTDIAAVAALLGTARVTSIIGTGGLGKTRLAHAVSRHAQQRVVHFVGLAGIAGDDDVAQEVASALGVGESLRSPATAADVIAATLGAGPVLLVLDNCEHVVRGVAALVRALVSMTADLRVLTTSRTPLGLSSESVYLLPELDLASTVALFTQRATAARPGVDLPADVVLELCRRLDGLPLAVELAAARVRVMSVAEITSRVADRFALLRGGARDAPQRHHTLHAVVDWSWHLLSPACQAAMRALSVFPGGFSADGARQLLGVEDALTVLADLVDQSLLTVTDTPTGTRFRMLETVREFSVAQLATAGETDEVVGRFLRWARQFGMARHESAFGADLFSSAGQIRAEQDNLSHALRIGLDNADGATVAAVTALLAGLWIIESDHARMAVLAGQTVGALSHYRPEPELVEVTRTAAALCALSMLLVQNSATPRSLLTLRRLPPTTPHTPVRALAVVLRAVPEILADDRAGLRALCAGAEPLLAGVANSVASYLWELEGDMAGALSAATSMLSAFEDGRAPWTWTRAVAHARIAELCLRIEQGDRATRHARAALVVLEGQGSRSNVAMLRWLLVLANLQRGALDEAEHWLELMELDSAIDIVHVPTPDLGARAEILLARGDVDAGLRLWRRAVDRLRNTERPAYRDEPPGLDPWTLEIEAVAVVAHAHHGRLDLVADITGELPTMLAFAVARPPAYVVDLPICGALLLALAMVDLDRDGTACSAVRLIALAERCRFYRSFQPTMSTDRARRIATKANRSAYEDAVSSYADLDGAQLRAAVLVALRER